MAFECVYSLSLSLRFIERCIQIEALFWKTYNHHIAVLQNCIVEVTHLIVDLCESSDTDAHFQVLWLFFVGFAPVDGPSGGEVLQLHTILAGRKSEAFNANTFVYSVQYKWSPL